MTKKQISSFKKHIDAAIQLNTPIIVHSRNAENETLKIFNEYKDEKLKILMHCFTGTKKFAEELMSLILYFLLVELLHLKNSTELQNTFKSIPIEKILIETDSPFLAPVPMRGKKNEPSFLAFTADKLGEIKDLPKSEIIKITSNNFNQLFFLAYYEIYYFRMW